MMAKRRRQGAARERGETLVEVLAALFLFGLLALTLISGIASIITLGKFRQQEAAVGAAIRTISEQLNAAYGSVGSTACTKPVADAIANQLTAFNTTNAALVPVGVKVFLPTVIGGNFSSGTLTFPASTNDCRGTTPPALAATYGTLQVNFTVAADGVDASGNPVAAQIVAGKVVGVYVRQVTLILGSPRV